MRVLLPGNHTPIGMALEDQYYFRQAGVCGAVAKNPDTVYRLVKANTHLSPWQSVPVFTERASNNYVSLIAIVC